jgi:Holliday junction DNA helicase RuvB
MVDEAEDTIEEVLEPHLIRCGLLARTARGRIATPQAYTHVGVEPPSRHTGELPFA